MNILDIFYNQIIDEASRGEIDAYFKYNIMFSTHIVDKNFKKDISSDLKKRYFVPTLVIKNKEEFDRLLCDYIELASKFYTDFDNFYSRISDEVNVGDKELLRIKTLFVNLFSNATEEDFNNPCEFLRKRIDFINNSCEQRFNEFYSENLKASIKVSIKKDSFNNETPYMFSVQALDENDNPYFFPNLKFGIHDGKAYVYAIQRNDKNVDNSKRINRGLYKTGEGFDSFLDNESIYEEGNLKDVTSSFLVVANLFLTYLFSLGIEEVVIPSILIERWNAKEMSLVKRFKAKRLDFKEYLKKLREHNKLQSNLTEKLVRTFGRIAHHYPNISLISYPGENDMTLRLNIANQELCNNKLLLELREEFLKIMDNKELQI